MILTSKIRLILGFCLLLVLFSSCRPKGVLSRKEMVRVLFDIHLTEAAVNEVSEPIPEEWTRGQETEFFKDMAYRSVLRKHHLSEETFYYSVSWYSRHMNLYEKIYIDVQARLDDFKASIDEGRFDKSGGIQQFGMDTAKVRAMYTYGLFRRDTVLARPSFLNIDSIPSSSDWYAKRWMYRFQKDTTRLNLYPELSIHSVFDTSNPDSLKAKADSLLRQSETLPRDLQKEVLAPGSRRLPTRNIRIVPKNEQIRKRFQQRAVEQEQLKRIETDRQRKERIEASKQVEPSHWK